MMVHIHYLARNHRSAQGGPEGGNPPLEPNNLSPPPPPEQILGPLPPKISAEGGKKTRFLAIFRQFFDIFKKCLRKKFFFRKNIFANYFFQKLPVNRSKMQ